MSKHYSASGEKVRFQPAVRNQIEYQDWCLEQLIPHDHRVRSVWAFVDRLNLSALYSEIRAVEGGVGRDPVDPKILLALWIFAITEGVTRARHLERLCKRDLPYMWICGGVSVNYHLLSDFRTDHGEFLDQLLTDTITTLMHQGLVTLENVAQDGMRVRANAGSSSFRRRQTLERLRDEAAQAVQRFHDNPPDGDDSDSKDRRKAAQERAARERAERVQKALEELDQLAQQKEKRNPGSGEKTRCSTTDPEAHKVKTADGGFRPAYNVQFATDGANRFIVAVDVENTGSDRGQMTPMHEEISKRYGKTAENYLVDCGFATKEDITDVERAGSQVHAPVHGEEQMRKRGNDPYERKSGDSDEMFRFRQRMATDEAKERYRLRSSIAEYANAESRNRGLQQFAVRGLKKVKTVSLWHAVVFNFMRMNSLGLIGT
jgi:transposase